MTYGYNDASLYRTGIAMCLSSLPILAMIVYQSKQKSKVVPVEAEMSVEDLNESSADEEGSGTNHNSRSLTSMATSSSFQVLHIHNSSHSIHEEDEEEHTHHKGVIHIKVHQVTNNNNNNMRPNRVKLVLGSSNA